MLARAASILLACLALGLTAIGCKRFMNASKTKDDGVQDGDLDELSETETELDLFDQGVQDQSDILANQPNDTDGIEVQPLDAVYQVAMADTGLTGPLGDQSSIDATQTAMALADQQMGRTSGAGSSPPSAESQKRKILFDSDAEFLEDCDNDDITIEQKIQQDAEVQKKLKAAQDKYKVAMNNAQHANCRIPLDGSSTPDTCYCFQSFGYKKDKPDFSDTLCGKRGCRSVVGFDLPTPDLPMFLSKGSDPAPRMGLIFKAQEDMKKYGCYLAKYYDGNNIIPNYKFQSPRNDWVNYCNAKALTDNADPASCKARGDLMNDGTPPCFCTTLAADGKAVPQETIKPLPPVPSPFDNPNPNGDNGVACAQANNCSAGLLPGECPSGSALSATGQFNTGLCVADQSGAPQTNCFVQKVCCGDNNRIPTADYPCDYKSPAEQAIAAANKPLIDKNAAFVTKNTIDPNLDLITPQPVMIRLYCQQDWAISASPDFLINRGAKKLGQLGSTYSLVYGSLSSQTQPLKDRLKYMELAACRDINTRWESECNQQAAFNNLTHPPYFTNWQCLGKAVQSDAADNTTEVGTGALRQKDCTCTYYQWDWELQRNADLREGFETAEYGKDSRYYRSLAQVEQDRTDRRRDLDDAQTAVRAAQKKLTDNPANANLTAQALLQSITAADPDLMKRYRCSRRRYYRAQIRKMERSKDIERFQRMSWGNMCNRPGEKDTSDQVAMRSAILANYANATGATGMALAPQGQDPSITAAGCEKAIPLYCANQATSPADMQNCMKTLTAQLPRIVPPDQCATPAGPAGPAVPAKAGGPTAPACGSVLTQLPATAPNPNFGATPVASGGTAAATGSSTPGAAQLLDGQAPPAGPATAATGAATTAQAAPTLVKPANQTAPSDKPPASVCGLAYPPCTPIIYFDPTSFEPAPPSNPGIYNTNSVATDRNGCRYDRQPPIKDDCTQYGGDMLCRDSGLWTCVDSNSGIERATTCRCDYTPVTPTVVQ